MSGLHSDVARAWIEFGKVGLLIDDSVGAPSAVARQIYGADALPSWWVVARCLKTGTKLLQDLIWCRKNWGGASISGVLVVIDRFLPPTCSGTLPSRPVAWDEVSDGTNSETQKIKTEFREQFQKLYQIATREERRWYGRLVTSYAHKQLQANEEHDTSSGLPEHPWHQRSIEVPYQLGATVAQQEDALTRGSDGQIQAWGCWSLLSYGPSPGALCTRLPPDELGLNQAQLDIAKWHAEAWQYALLELTQFLKRANNQVNLMTEYRASVASGPTGAGMRPWSWMVEQALRYVRREQDTTSGAGHTAHQVELRLPHELQAQRCDGCAPGGDEGKGTHQPASSDSGSELTLSAAWRKVQSSSSGQTPVLREHQLEPLKKMDFHGNHLEPLIPHVARLVRRCDYATPYKYWLLARLHWRQLLTVNFDHFHERAESSLEGQEEVSPRCGGGRIQHLRRALRDQASLQTFVIDGSKLTIKAPVTTPADAPYLALIGEGVYLPEVLSADTTKTSTEARLRSEDAVGPATSTSASGDQSEADTSSNAPKRPQLGLSSYGQQLRRLLIVTGEPPDTAARRLRMNGVARATGLSWVESQYSRAEHRLQGDTPPPKDEIGRDAWLKYVQKKAHEPESPVLLTFNLRPLDFAFDLTVMHEDTECHLDAPESFRNAPRHTPPWLGDLTVVGEEPKLSVCIQCDLNPIPEDKVKHIKRDLKTALEPIATAGLIQLVECAEEAKLVCRLSAREEAQLVCKLSAREEAPSSQGEQRSHSTLCLSAGDELFELTVFERGGADADWRQTSTHFEAIVGVARWVAQWARRRAPGSAIPAPSARREFLRKHLKSVAAAALLKRLEPRLAIKLGEDRARSLVLHLLSSSSRKQLSAYLERLNGEEHLGLVRCLQLMLRQEQVLDAVRHQLRITHGKPESTPASAPD